MQDVAANEISFKLLPSHPAPWGCLPVCPAHRHSPPVFSPMPHTQAQQPSKWGNGLASGSQQRGKVGFTDTLQETTGPGISSGSLRGTLRWPDTCHGRRASFLGRRPPWCPFPGSGNPLLFCLSQPLRGVSTLEINPFGEGTFSLNMESVINFHVILVQDRC